MRVRRAEKIILSSTVFKFNHVNKRQERILLLTNRNIYNIAHGGVIKNLLAKMIQSIRIKRKIPLEMVEAVTITRFGTEFVIHVPKEYDYRFSSLKGRDIIVYKICEAYMQLTSKKLGFFYKVASNRTARAFPRSQRNASRKPLPLPFFACPPKKP